MTKDEIIECLKERQNGLSQDLMAFVRGAPKEVSSEQLMGKVRYDMGRINEIEYVIHWLSLTRTIKE